MSDAIWIVVEQREGKLHRTFREAIAAGQQLAALTGGAAEAVVLGHGVETLAREIAAYELAAVRVADAETLASYTPGAYVGALAPAIRAERPRCVVFPHTYRSVDFVGRLAQEAAAGLLPEATAVAREGETLVWRRPVLGGKLEARVAVRGEGPLLVTVQSGAFPGDQAIAGSAPIRALELDAAAVRPDREILGVEEVGGDHADLSQAEVIVAVGRGVGGAEKMPPIEELAQELGAEIGASRPVIDSGWLPRDRQIGSSGQTVAPKLYIALGVSGAIQHLVGMKGSHTVVAVNKDATAPIFGVATYGIVGDLHEVVPALTAALRAAREA